VPACRCECKRVFGWRIRHSLPKLTRAGAGWHAQQLQLAQLKCNCNCKEPRLLLHQLRFHGQCWDIYICPLYILFTVCTYIHTYAIFRSSTKSGGLCIPVEKLTQDRSLYRGWSISSSEPYTYDYQVTYFVLFCFFITLLVNASENIYSSYRFWKKLNYVCSCLKHII